MRIEKYNPDRYLKESQNFVKYGCIAKCEILGVRDAKRRHEDFIFYRDRAGNVNVAVLVRKDEPNGEGKACYYGDLYHLARVICNRHYPYHEVYGGIKRYRETDRVHRLLVNQFK